MEEENVVLAGGTDILICWDINSLCVPSFPSNIFGIQLTSASKKIKVFLMIYKSLLKYERFHLWYKLQDANDGMKSGLVQMNKTSKVSMVTYCNKNKHHKIIHNKISLCHLHDDLQRVTSLRFNHLTHLSNTSLNNLHIVLVNVHITKSSVRRSVSFDVKTHFIVFLLNQSVSAPVTRVWPLHVIRSSI